MIGLYISYRNTSLNSHYLLPSKHETLAQSCFNAGPLSATLPNIRTALDQRIELAG